jgi:hypothetical protein
MNYIHLESVKFRKMNKNLFFEQDEYFEPNWNDRNLPEYEKFKKYK